jgi:hypothetical protein
MQINQKAFTASDRGVVSCARAREEHGGEDMHADE